VVGIKGQDSGFGVVTAPGALRLRQGKASASASDVAMANTFGSWVRSFFGVHRADEAPTLDDSQRFDWDVHPVPERVIAIGDLHGDVRALGALLAECRLIDRAGAWSGGEAHLVLMGDLLGGSDQSRLLLDAVLRLELEAERARGRVHALLGNHDILPAAGRFGKLTRRERELFTIYPVPGAAGPTLEDAFRGDSVYARWLRRRPALLKIGATLFVHAGIEKWAKKHDPAAINEAVRSWIAYWQGVGARPDKASRWMVARQSGDGPLWTRAFKGKAEDGPSRKALRAMLVGYGAKRVVVGHAPTADGAIALEHPRYGDAVILIDTRISDPRRGRMSALEIRGDALAAVYAAERSTGRALEDLAEAALRGEATAPPLSLWTRARRWFSGTA
jgi:hypothetical protein